MVLARITSFRTTGPIRTPAYLPNKSYTLFND
jgi:hypothetical protein